MKKLSLALLALCIPDPSLFAAEKPNIVVILADDLGYGDVRCNNPERGKIPTPNIDRLASQGMRFTDAHTSSGVCSPTRYSLLTGRYHWRTRLQAGIVSYLEKPLIAPERLTLAGLLKTQGYRSAAIGKWHLGWDWSIAPEQRELFAPVRKGARPGVTEAHRAAWKEVYARPIGGGPTTRGFDEYFGTDVPNWPPYAFIRNDRTVGIPSEFPPAALFKGKLASILGPGVPGWKLEDVLPTLTHHACAFIEDAVKAGIPFFLYMPLTAPHTPIAVADEWRGKSGINDYADFVMEVDAMVGRVLASLEKSGAAEKTLVLFTSDNGCSPLADVKALEAAGHLPSGPLRGYKTSAWEGGHRVPFIVRWPGKVKGGARCDQLVQQSDLMATFADVLGVKVPAGAGEDSVSLLPLFRGVEKPVREYAVSHASSGLPALRKGHWKVIFGPDGGGAREGGDATPAGQLYDLATDLGETRNLWKDKPELVAELTTTMESIVGSHPNDVPVHWQRFLKGEPRKTEARLQSPPQEPARSIAAELPQPSQVTPDGDAQWLREKGSVIFHDPFEREEDGNGISAIGNGWESATASRAPQIKQADLDAGVLKIFSATKEAGHAAHIHHDAGFSDGGVVVRFKFPGLSQGESLQLGFVDRETKGIHAGHLCYAILAQSNVTLIDHKTGIMSLENRKRRDDALARKEPLPADLAALLKSRQHVVPWKSDQEWHDLALVTEGDEMRLSIDGRLVARHRSEGFAHPRKRWFSFLVPSTVWIEDVKIWKIN